MIRLQHIFTVFLFVLLASQTATAQDVITLRTGDEIKAKIIEVSQTDIRYKRTDNLTGPTFVQAISGVFMIRYENGQKDVFKSFITPQNEPVVSTPADRKVAVAPRLSYSKIAFGRHFYENGAPTTPEHVQTLMATNPMAMRYFQKGNGGNTGYYLLGIPSGIIVGAFLGIALGNPDADLNKATPVLVVGVAGMIGSYVLLGSANRNYRRAVEAYNEGVKTAQVRPMRLEIGLASSGQAALRLRF